MPRRAVFLDRDGVIVENRNNYCRSWMDVIFLPGAFKALQQLKLSDLVIVVVTNQSVVGRGLITLEQARALNRDIVAEIHAHGGRVDALYFCPHHPDDGCNCRKPRTEMFLSAAQDLDLALSNSYVIGDALSDMQSAEAISAQGILVLTGRGAQQAPLVRRVYVHCPIVPDLSTAVEFITQKDFLRVVPRGDVAE